jgi:hypothetical protein
MVWSQKDVDELEVGVDELGATSTPVDVLDWLVLY